MDDSENIYFSFLISSTSVCSIKKYRISDGEVSVIAGGSCGYVDGSGTSARFSVSSMYNGKDLISLKV